MQLPLPASYSCRVLTSLHPARLQWSTVDDVLALADYFGVGGILQSADTWLCTQYLQHAKPLSTQHACQAFELAARHRLGSAMALLLPWAVQCLARGSRCSTVW